MVLSSVLVLPRFPTGQRQLPRDWLMAQRLAAFPDFTWEVKANDRAYHKQFKKRVAFCLTRKKYEVSHLASSLCLFLATSVSADFPAGRANPLAVDGA